MREIAGHMNPRCSVNWDDPQLGQIMKLVCSIDRCSREGRRDQALISFLFMSAMHSEEIITLPLGCLRLPRLIVLRMFLPSRYRSALTDSTSLIAPDIVCTASIFDWISELRDLGLYLSDPLFPRIASDKQPRHRILPDYWSTPNTIKEILKFRCRARGLKYIPPEMFRRTAIDLAVRNCSNSTQIRAVFQNFNDMEAFGNLSNPDRLEPSVVAEWLRFLNCVFVQRDEDAS